MNFAARALALCGLAARSLGWRPQEFWSATPAELAASLGLLAPETPGMNRDALHTLMERDHG
ncbi:phage tail assembly chaperone [Novosphingobium panipatense]|uniref:Phage tail assembly chaperone protein, TAC n=1 Tax=Novosphingobium panipatense TaxID=428991 RepID=A0ABY1QHC4_9SPHN|nr:phage tail assembly chaperone [Novosphingobium panipatense]SMP69328.1 Phage tail assembly chaperone protein, TAC [Novosphingobium panipatense]